MWRAGVVSHVGVVYALVGICLQTQMRVVPKSKSCHNGIELRQLKAGG